MLTVHSISTELEGVNELICVVCIGDKTDLEDHSAEHNDGNGADEDEEELDESKLDDHLWTIPLRDQPLEVIDL